jgi:capsular polysaccharide biosynthesis protein
MAYVIKPKSFSSKYNYQKPLNFNENWAHLFKPDYAYTKVKLGARILKNVFVNHYGLVLNNGLLVKGCAPNIGHTNYEDEKFYFSHWKKVTEQFLVAKFGKSLPSTRLDDSRTYLVIHSPWFSYYFWITECLPRLLMVKEMHKDLVLIYPESWKNIAFVNESLSLFSDLDKIIIPRDVHLFVKNLVMPEVKPWTPMFIPELVQDTRSLLLNAFGEERNLKNIYISRKKAQRRQFNNENFVEEFFQSHGLESVVMEEMSFKEQIAVMYNSKIAAGITGAGLVNLMFMKEGSTFFDLTNIGYLSSKIYKFHYFKLANILKINYAVQFFKYEEIIEIKKFTQKPLIPDFDLMKFNINLIKNQQNN